MRRLLALPVLVAGLVLVAGCGSGTTSTSPATTAEATTTASDASPTATVAVQKDVLGTDVDPPGALGRTLTLIRYTIAPGAKLAPHVHPGVQMASIQSGSLTYTVVSGTATVQRAGGSAVEPVTGPSTITLGPGDAVIEKDDMVHFGANTTDGPVVIVATLLTEDGSELAIPVTTVAATTTPG